MLRTVIALLVLFLLVRAGLVAWRQRALTRAVWRAVTWRHLVGSIGLLGLVLVTATVLLIAVPGMDVGLGRLVGTTGNAVFTPLEQGLAWTGPAPPTGTDWALLVGGSTFLGLLALLLPWLAFVEEEVFRAGLEVASWPRVVVASLGFGLLHLIMLVPLAAALAIGVAGFGYAVVYRRAHATHRAARGVAPGVAVRTFRPTRRALAVVASSPDPTWQDAQAAGVFQAAVWHTTVNTLIVATVWTTVVLGAVA